MKHLRKKLIFGTALMAFSGQLFSHHPADSDRYCDRHPEDCPTPVPQDPIDRVDPDDSCGHGDSSGQFNRRTIEILNRSMTVELGETKSIKLKKRYFVHKLLIQAVSANSQDSYGEVIVNGDVKGTLYLPGVDPHYVVTIADSTRSIEWTSLDNSMKILKVKAVVSSVECREAPLNDRYRSEIESIAARILKIANHLESHVSYENYGQYLLPVRKMAAKALAYARARGDLSERSRHQYWALYDSLFACQSFISELVEVDETQDEAIELMTMRERIRLILF